jgi:hypothetical protein
MIDRYRLEPYLSADIVFAQTHQNAKKELDLSFLFVVGLVGIMAMRYLSYEIENNSSFYKMLGGFAMIVLLIFRPYYNKIKAKI